MESSCRAFYAVEMQITAHTHKPSINGENVNNMHQMILLMQKCYKSTTNNPYFCMRLNCEKWKKMKGSIVTIENKKETECAV